MDHGDGVGVVHGRLCAHKGVQPVDEVILPIITSWAWS